MFVAAQRHGSVRAVPVKNDQIAELRPVINKIISRKAELMSDGHRSYQRIGSNFATHDTVCHGKREYARGQIHTNTAESFGALLERTKLGVFHFLSSKHVHRYLNELEFRWDHRIPEEKITRTGNKKIVMKPMPVLQMLSSLLSAAAGTQLRRTTNRGILSFNAV